MSAYLDHHATATERAEADRLAKIDILKYGNAIHDLDVSCYTGTGEDGRPEDVHETRLSDGACRCGYNKSRRWDVTLTHDAGTLPTVHTHTWGPRRSSAYARVVEIIERPEWDGWSFTVAERPTLITPDFPTYANR